MAVGPPSVYLRAKPHRFQPEAWAGRITGVETKARGAQQLLKRLEAAWRAFTQSYTGLPEPDCSRPGVTGALVGEDIIGT